MSEARQPAEEAPPPGGGWTATALVALGLLALLPFVLYRQFLSDEALIYGFDSAQSHLARFTILRDALVGEGRLPLWQVTSYGGGPFHGNIENPTLYPPALLAAWLWPPLLAMNVVILAHLALAAVGMALLVERLARRLLPAGARGPALAGALVAATLFAFNRNTRVETFNLVTYGASHALIPWVLWALDGLLHGRRPAPWAGACALLAAAFVFTGGTYLIGYGSLAFALWFVVEGLLGGAEARRRALRWGPVVAALALLLVLGKALPYLDWVSTTNRAGALPPGVARGVTLAGEDGFDAATLAERLRPRTNGYLLLGAAALGVLVLRRRTGVLVVGLAVFGIAASAGLLHGVLLDHVPPFDRIRNASRAWCLANAFLPLAAGLGLAALLAWPRWRLGGERPAALRGCVLGAFVVCAALLPRLLETDRFQPLFDEPDRLEDVLGLYRNFPSAARAAGDEARVTSLEIKTLGTRNEQVIASLTGAEVLGGFFGFAFPRAVARHAYDNEGAVAPETRLRRLAAFSVGQVVFDDRPRVRPPWTGRHEEPFPPGVDGTTHAPLPGARPRAWLPARTALLVGDDADDAWLYALFDALTFDPAAVSLLTVPGDRPPADALVAAVDELLVVTEGCAPETLEALRATAGDRLRELAAAPTAPEAVAAELVTRARVSGRTGRAADFERVDSHRTRVTLPGAEPAPAVLVVSETWALHGGWVIDADGAPLDIAPVRADGISSAVLLPAEAAVLEAAYEPPAVGRGLLGTAAGLLGCLVLLLLPTRRRDG